jgi:hypothetical protein
LVGSLWVSRADQLDLPAVDAAGCIDLLHGHLAAAIDPDAGR